MTKITPAGTTPTNVKPRQQGKTAAMPQPAKPAPLVTSWTLKRSGAAMTLTGLVDGGPIIQGGLVRAYLAASGEIVATHDDGRTWRLSKS